MTIIALLVCVGSCIFGLAVLIKKIDPPKVAVAICSTEAQGADVMPEQVPPVQDMPTEDAIDPVMTDLMLRGVTAELLRTVKLFRSFMNFYKSRAYICSDERELLWKSAGAVEIALERFQCDIIASLRSTVRHLCDMVILSMAINIRVRKGQDELYVQLMQELLDRSRYPWEMSRSAELEVHELAGNLSVVCESLNHSHGWMSHIQQFHSGNSFRVLADTRRILCDIESKLGKIE